MSTVTTDSYHICILCVVQIKDIFCPIIFKITVYLQGVSKKVLCQNTTTSKKNFLCGLFFGTLCITMFFIVDKKNCLHFAGHVSCTYNLVGYWGTVKDEPDLFKVCESSPYSKIVVGFIDFKSKSFLYFYFFEFLL